VVLAARRPLRDSEFRYGGRPVEPLQTLDRGGRVVYIGTFSKTMLATLRLGFVVAPRPLARAVAEAKFLADWHTALPLQATLADFIDQGWFARHVRRMRGVYAERHRRIVEVLGERSTDHLKVIPALAGLHVAATAPAMSHEELAAVLAHARAAGVELLSLSHFEVGPPGIVLGYGAIPTDRVDEGLRRLRAAFDRH
jgi:GntR family transcriptional regulator/MocR family aminotransferase